MAIRVKPDYDIILSRLHALPDGSPPEQGCRYDSAGDLVEIIWKEGSTPIDAAILAAEWPAVRAELVYEQKSQRFFRDTDRLLRVVVLLVAALRDERGKLRPAALSTPLDAQVSTQLDALDAVLSNMRNP